MEVLDPKELKIIELIKKFDSSGLKAVITPVLTEVCAQTTDEVTFAVTLVALKVMTENQFQQFKIEGTPIQKNYYLYTNIMKKPAGKELIEAILKSENSHIIKILVKSYLKVFAKDYEDKRLTNAVPTSASTLESESATGYGDAPLGFYSVDEHEQYFNGAVTLATKHINILLLGETGVGKSTFINGLANYLTFSTLEDAKRGRIKVLIPSKFIMMKENYEEVPITVGENDSNEVHSSGQSATQHPVTYTFMVGRTFVQLIDTPGVGDTRGIKQGNFNFQNIMNHLAHVGELHGICILLKPIVQSSVLFEFFIKEILTHLHRDAAANIAFCFTDARSTFNRPGDTFIALKALLNDDGKSEPIVKLVSQNVYCVESGSFRFLAAVKHGEKFNDNVQKDYTKSWTESVKETARLIKYFEGIKPHKTTDTLTLNSTRQVIVPLAKLMVNISEKYQWTIATKLTDCATELQTLVAHRDDLMGKLNVPKVNLELCQLLYPKMVCASPNCTEKIPERKMRDGTQIFRTNYKQVCHERCMCISRDAMDQQNHPGLRQCDCMGPDFNCKQCGHSWETHMRITHEMKQVTVQTIDQEVALQIQTTEGRIAAFKSVVAQCEQKKREYEGEQDIITKSAARFAVFLKQNSITPYNDAFIRYLDDMIKTEQDKIQNGGAIFTVGQLQELKQVYLQEEKILLAAINNPQGASNISLQTIQDSLTELYNLPLNGRTIKNLMEGARHRF